MGVVEDSSKDQSEDDDADVDGAGEDEDDGVLPGVVSVRLGRVIPRSDKPSWDEPRWLSVEDPFETNRNVANTLQLGEAEATLLKELRRAAEITEQPSESDGGGVLAKLLEPVST